MMGFELVKGRMFSPAFPADTINRMVVNEATLSAFEIPTEMALGQTLNFDWQGAMHTYEIIGVVKDFHFEALHHQIHPYAFLLQNRPDFNYIITHVNTANVGDVVAFLEQQWRDLNPQEPFEYSFLKEDFQKNHLAEDRVLRIIGSFTIISIIISCLGLFGLAAFATQQRTKEIGIRKVLGATVADVVTMLSKDFIKLILIAIMISTPLAWYAMSRWLQVFAYRIEVAWWMFMLTGMLAVAIALVTVSFQSIKAALMNPVKSLRTE
jgi:putative ABC transport system permease protein